MKRGRPEMIQEVIIEKESLEYYQYLDQKYREIVSFLGKTDGAVDLVKVQLYFDRVTVPFSSWCNGKEETVQGKPSGEISTNYLSTEERKNHLDALCKIKKYGLQEKDGKYIVRPVLDEVVLNELKKKMESLDFRYIDDSNSRRFVEVKE